MLTLTFINGWRDWWEKNGMGAYNDNAQRLNVVWLRELLQVSISVTILQGANEINS